MHLDKELVWFVGFEEKRGAKDENGRALPASKLSAIVRSSRNTPSGRSAWAAREFLDAGVFTGGAMP